MLLNLQDQPVSVVAAGAVFLSYLVLLVIQSLIKSYRRSIFKTSKGCKPAPRYPHKDPILGLDVVLENFKVLKNGTFLARLEERYALVSKRYNRFVDTYTALLTGQGIILTSNPENIKAVLAVQFKDFKLPDNRKTAFAPMFGHGIFTTDGKEWEASRALLRPNFSRNLVGDLDTYEEHVAQLIARIPRDGSTFDIQSLFFLLTMDSATDFLFGQSANSLGKGSQHEHGLKFAEAFTNATEVVGTMARLGPAGRLLDNKQYRADMNFVHEYAEEYVQKAVNFHQTAGEKEEKGKTKYVFLEGLAQTGYDKKKIRDELLNILLAGRDTTAGSLSYLFYMLARHPRVLQRLRQEILAMGSDRPTFEQIKACRYLQWTLNEVLRLLPIVPANGRQAVVDTTLPNGGGPDGKSPVFVKAGQIVVYQVYVMHRRKDIYGEDADEFRPERWEKLRPGWEYLPFNGGPRICLGQQFALMEMSYVTSRLLQQFKNVESRDETPFREHMTITASVKGGVQIAMTPA